MSRRRRRTTSVDEEEEDFIDEEEIEETDEDDESESESRSSRSSSKRRLRTREEYEVELAIYEREKEEYEKALAKYKASQRILSEYEGFLLPLTGMTLIEKRHDGNAETTVWLLEFKDKKSKEKVVIQVEGKLDEWHFRQGKYMFPKPIYIYPKPEPPKKPERPLTAF